MPILYIPKAAATEVLSPVVAEARNTADRTFIHRIMKYCNHVIEKYHVEPIVLTICVNRIRECGGDLFADTAKAPFLSELPSEFWAQEHLFINKHIISAFLNTPLSEMVAPGYVLTEQ